LIFSNQFPPPDSIDFCVFSRFAGFRTASAHLPTRFGKVLLDFDIVVLNLSKKANFGAVKICLFARASPSFVSERRSIPPQSGILEVECGILRLSRTMLENDLLGRAWCGHARPNDYPLQWQKI